MTAMRTLLGRLCVICALSGPVAAEAASMPGADDPSLDTSLALPPVIEDWLPPSWWQPIDIVYGLLDDDSFEDMVVLLQRPADAPEDPPWSRGTRALLVLFNDQQGGWRRGPLVPGLLPCADCSGRLTRTTESALYDIEIGPDGVLEIGWIHRDASTKAVRLYIGWDEAERRLGLLADDVSVINRYGVRYRVRRDFGAGTMSVDGRLQPMPPRFIPIEDVSAASY